MACENCSRLERAIYALITQNTDTIQTLQPVANALGVPLDSDTARLLDSLANQGKAQIAESVIKQKRKASPYAKKYGRAFKKVSKKYMKKSGGWKKNGFKAAQKAAHKLAKGMK